MKDIIDEYVHIVRLALQGRPQEVAALARKNLRYLNKINPTSAESIKQMLTQHEERTASLVRDAKQQPLPIDTDSKLELLKRESVILDYEPVWSELVLKELSSVIAERNHEEDLFNEGLVPTRSILFVGPPGVGKTLAARWLSAKLSKPLLTLDLAAVMSSFLGKTGNNIRAVLNYAQKSSSILLLDEFDAIAKRRNDDSEIGELKRLVNVLLQAVDDWPSTGILIAATNHPELLDPAVWRRFERVVHFPFPNSQQIFDTINLLLLNSTAEKEENYASILSIVLEGNSYAEVVRQINAARRESVIKKTPLNNMLEDIVLKICKEMDREKRVVVAANLLKNKFSQRRVSELTGLSRDTLRKYTKKS